MRRLALLAATFALAAFAVGMIARAPAAQTARGTYEACRSGEDTISASSLPENVSLRRCPVGERVITDHGVGTVLPDPGQSIFVDATTTEGSQEFDVTHYTDGTVELNYVGDETAQSESGIGTAARGPGECSDIKFYQPKPKYKVYVVLRQYFNPRTTPNELSRKGAVSAIRRGTADIYNTRNNCGMGDRVPKGAGMSYEGSVKVRAQVGTGGGCTGNDQKSVVSFGTLPESALAVTCTVRQLQHGLDRTKWSDVMINKAHYRWTTRPRARSCKGKYDLESILAHERGHTFGLGHVSESSHGNLTMSDTSNGPCQSSERSLGRGDVLGLGHKY